MKEIIVKVVIIQVVNDICKATLERRSEITLHDGEKIYVDILSANEVTCLRAWDLQNVDGQLRG